MKRITALVVGLIVAGCGDDDHGLYDSYDDGNVSVLGDDSVTVSGPIGSGDCIAISSDVCVDVDRDDSTWCERDGGPADVIMVDGVAIEVVCYPPADDASRSTVTIDGTTTGDIDIVQNANNTTVTFDDSLNGTPFVGDVSLDGNNVALYGNGPDNTIIDGNVVVTGNNVRIRGVTITGNLTIILNSAAIVLNRVYGNVEIAKNNTIFAQNDVYGNFTSTANNELYVDNHVQGTWSVSDGGAVCDDNFAFSDTNGNHVIDDGEGGASLGCD